MSIDFAPQQWEETKPRITVIGGGGAGGIEAIKRGVERGMGGGIGLIPFTGLAKRNTGRWQISGIRFTERPVGRGNRARGGASGRGRRRRVSHGEDDRRPHGGRHGALRMLL